MEIVAHSSKMTESQEIPHRCAIQDARVRKSEVVIMMPVEGRKGSTFPNPEGSEIFIF